MRPRPSHAAVSSVGKHTARESEAPNVVRMGKSAWRAPTPDFGPGAARLPGLNLLSDIPLSARWARVRPGTSSPAGPGALTVCPARRRGDQPSLFELWLTGNHGRASARFSRSEKPGRTPGREHTATESQQRCNPHQRKRRDQRSRPTDETTEKLRPWPRRRAARCVSP